jgi:hypothetical protein
MTTGPRSSKAVEDVVVVRTLRHERTRNVLLGTDNVADPGRNIAGQQSECHTLRSSGFDFTDPWYWDQNDTNRAIAREYFAALGRMPEGIGLERSDRRGSPVVPLAAATATIRVILADVVALGHDKLGFQGHSVRE